MSQDGPHSPQPDQVPQQPDLPPSNPRAPIRPDDVRDLEAGIVAEDQTRLAPVKANRPKPIKPEDVRDQQSGVTSEDQTRLAQRPPKPGGTTAPMPPASADISTALNADSAGPRPELGGSGSGIGSGASWGGDSRYDSYLGSGVGQSTHGSLGTSGPGSESWRRGSTTGRSGYRYSRPVDRYTVPEEEIEQPKHTLNVRTLLIGLVGLIIFGIVAGFLYVRFIRDVAPSADVSVKPSTSTSGGPRIGTPEEVVRKYLHALADGDVTTAISMGPRSPGEMVAITSQAYAKSLQTHPITDISVPRQDNVSSFVAASYKVGGQQVDTRFRVQRNDDGGWRLARSTIEFKFNYRNAEGLPLLLNGERLEGTTAALLPGSYSVATGLPFIDFGRDDRVTISNLEYEGTVQRTLTPALTAEGGKVLLQAGRNSLQECLNSGSLNPSGCPNQMHASAPYEPSSVKWALIDDPFANTAGSLDINRATWGQASVLLRFEVSFTYTDGTTSGTQRPTPITASFGADMSVTDQAAVRVVWS